MSASDRHHRQPSRVGSTHGRVENIAYEERDPRVGTAYGHIAYDGHDPRVGTTRGHVEEHTRRREGETVNTSGSRDSLGHTRVRSRESDQSSSRLGHTRMNSRESDGQRPGSSHQERTSRRLGHTRIRSRESHGSRVQDTSTVTSREEASRLRQSLRHTRQPSRESDARSTGSRRRYYEELENEPEKENDETIDEEEALLEALSAQRNGQNTELITPEKKQEIVPKQIAEYVLQNGEGLSSGQTLEWEGLSFTVEGKDGEKKVVLDDVGFTFDSIV
jgi:hypothetical protein